jgi:hypothetical protein
MIYRKLDTFGDYTFGRGASNFLVDSPAAVAQAISTRLKLIQGEWFLDIQAGVPYNTQVLGFGTIPYYDFAIKDAILNTPGVSSIINYSSYIDNRNVTITATVDTIYGQTTIEQVL